MGVHRLESFIERKIPNAYCKKVNIDELARQYKINTGKDPVMIVDGSYSLRTIYNSVSDWLLGGQLNEFVYEMKKFVSEFQNIGVKVMFYFDGATQETKRKTWISRRTRRLANIKELMKRLERSNYSVNKYFLLPPLIGALGRFIAKYECGCDVRISCGECGLELAEYARHEDCFAILSGDTDYMIMNGAQNYFSIERLDMSTMETLAYDREGFMKALSLQPHELPLLASLLGNDVVPIKELRPFHRRETRHYEMITYVLPAIVNYVRRLKPPKHGYRYLRNVAKDVFDSEDMARVLEESIRSYLPQPKAAADMVTANTEAENNWWRILEVAEERHKLCMIPPHLYPVLLGEAYELGEALEDYSSKHVTPAARIYLPLRQRIYGVLLHEKPDAIVVKEWCVQSKHSFEKPRYVPISRIPDIERIHPGLLRLWLDDPFEKWGLFARCLSLQKKLDLPQLVKLNFPYIVPVAVVMYLQHECKDVISALEVDILLIQAAIVGSQNMGQLEHTSNVMPTTEFIRLSTLFHRGVTTVLFLLAACGFALDKAMPWHYFDGKVLHEVYIQARKIATVKQLCSYKKDVLASFMKMKRILRSVQLNESNHL